MFQLLGGTIHSRVPAFGEVRARVVDQEGVDFLFAKASLEQGRDRIRYHIRVRAVGDLRVLFGPGNYGFAFFQEPMGIDRNQHSRSVTVVTEVADQIDEVRLGGVKVVAEIVKEQSSTLFGDAEE